MRTSPGCTCCNCEIGTDEFGYADGTDLDDTDSWVMQDAACNAPLTPVGGAMEVQSGVVESEADARATFIWPEPLSLTDYLIDIEAMGDDEGDELEVTAYADHAEQRCTYYAARLRLATADECGALEIYRWDDGEGETLIRSAPALNATVGEWHSLRVCLSRTSDYEYGDQGVYTITFTVTYADGSEQTLQAEFIEVDGGWRPGFATGDILTKGSFDNWRLRKLKSADLPHCPACGRATCLYSRDDFDRAGPEVGCLWEPIPSGDTLDAELGTEDTYPVMLLTRPSLGSHVSSVRHLIGHPFRKPFSKATFYIKFSAVESVAFTSVCSDTSGGIGWYLKAGDGDCGEVYFNSLLDAPSPVPGLVAGEWVEVEVCYGPTEHGDTYAHHITLNGYRFARTADLIEPDVNGPFEWFMLRLAENQGAAGDQLFFRDFQLAMTQDSTYSASRRCETCIPDDNWCLWYTGLCDVESCHVQDDGIWTCPDPAICFATKVVAESTDGRRTLLVPNTLGSNCHRITGYLSGGEGKQRVLVSVNLAGDKYLGLELEKNAATDCSYFRLIDQDGALAEFPSAMPGQGPWEFCLTANGASLIAVLRKYNLLLCGPFNGFDWWELSALATPDADGLYMALEVAYNADTQEYHQLMAWTARSEAHPDCPYCEECSVFTDGLVNGNYPTLGCEYSDPPNSAYLPGKGQLTNGETATVEWDALDEEFIVTSVRVIMDYSGQTWKVDLSDGYWIQVEYGANNLPGRVTTAFGSDDEFPYGALAPAGTAITPVEFEIQACAYRGRIRLCVNGQRTSERHAYPILTYSSDPAQLPGVTWQNKWAIQHVTSGDGRFYEPKFNRPWLSDQTSCRECTNYCQACSEFVMPTLATIEASWITGDEFCDAIAGINYVEMIGCEGLGPFDPNALHHYRYAVLVESFTTYVRVRVRVYAQPDYPNVGQYYYWDAIISGGDSIDCVNEIQGLVCEFNEDDSDDFGSCYDGFVGTTVAITMS